MCCPKFYDDTVMSWFDFAFFLLISCRGLRGRLGSSELLWPKPSIIAIFKQRHRALRNRHIIFDYGFAGMYIAF